MIHTASLIHDDVLDESDMRRGKNYLHIDRRRSILPHFICSVLAVSSYSIEFETYLQGRKLFIKCLVQEWQCWPGTSCLHNRHGILQILKIFRSLSSLAR